MSKLLHVLLSREFFALGLRDLRAHKLRSSLTALGVIFGVAAVICMLSIGEGASAETLQQLQLLGSQNIILQSIEPPKSQDASQAQQAIKKYGIRTPDIQRIAGLPHVGELVLMRDVANTIVHGSRQFDGHVLGVTENFFDVVNVRIARGRAITALDNEHHTKVGVIGHRIARRLFPNSDPLGETIHVRSRSTGPVPYTIVGILAEVATAGTPAKGQAARDINSDLYIPITTADLRYGDIKVTRSGINREAKDVEFSDVYVYVNDQEEVLAVSRMISRVLAFGQRQGEYVMTVPLELLMHARQTKRTFQIVLGSIAGISLLVGGIGIMNIMLASVTERTREIGIRRALGAKRYHITAQFLIQTLILSVLGGAAGIVLGVGMAFVVTWWVTWQTIVPIWGVVLSFCVAAVVGVVFGLYPARAAARLDPIEALNSTARNA